MILAGIIGFIIGLVFLEILLWFTHRDASIIYLIRRKPKGTTEVTFKEDIDMLNPHSEMITDECSGIEVTNQRYIDWEAGAKAARDEILELVKEEYPLIVTWPAWKRFTGERIV